VLDLAALRADLDQAGQAHGQVGVAPPAVTQLGGVPLAADLHALREDRLERGDHGAEPDVGVRPAADDPLDVGLARRGAVDPPEVEAVGLTT